MTDGVTPASGISSLPTPRYCAWCGSLHGARCPAVKAIEYHENGTVRRVEFVTPEPIGITAPNVSIAP